jgi:hypothetical protein
MIDDAILSCVLPRWQKVAMVVSVAGKKLEMQFPEFSYILYAKRIRLLAKQGRLESQGDLRYMRFSEVRRPMKTNQSPEASTVGATGSAARSTPQADIGSGLRR